VDWSFTSDFRKACGFQVEKSFLVCPIREQGREWEKKIKMELGEMS